MAGWVGSSMGVEGGCAAGGARTTAGSGCTAAVFFLDDEPQSACPRALPSTHATTTTTTTTRFTWEVIRRARERTSVVLTTHSMEEADVLGDRILIMANGRLVAGGTGLELKVRGGRTRACVRARALCWLMCWCVCLGVRRGGLP